MNRGALPADEAFGSLEDLASGEIAIALKHPAYDCYYLALALRENAPLVTEDRRLLQLARQHERFRSLVLSLDDANRIRP